MSWDMERKLASIRKRAEPRRDFEVALRKELVPRTTHYALRTTFLHPAVLATSLVMVLGAGTATYAYTSDDVLPDHPLYPVRVGLEQVEEAVATTPDVLARVEVKHAERRAKEVQKLNDTHKQITIAQVDNMNQSLDKAEAAGANISNEKRHSFDRELSRVERDHERVVGALPDKVFSPEDASSVSSTDEDLAEPAMDQIDPIDETANVDTNDATDTADTTDLNQNNRVDSNARNQAEQNSRIRIHQR
jgi:hypothetical protein